MQVLTPKMRRYAHATLKRSASRKLERYTEEPEPGTSECISPPCLGVRDAKLQSYAQLPPGETATQQEKDKCPSYYLQVRYQETGPGEVTTCATTIRSHNCSALAQPNSELCKACSSARLLVLKKHVRHEQVSAAQVRKFSPLSTLSKQRLSNALKLARLEKTAAEKQLNNIRTQLEKESLEVSASAHAKLKDTLDACEMEQNSFVKKFWTELYMLLCCCAVNC